MARNHSKYDWSALIFTLRGEDFIGCSQEGLARILEASSRSVSKWENSLSTPQLKFRKKLMLLAEEEGFKRDLWPRLERKRPQVVPSKPSNQQSRQ